MDNQSILNLIGRRDELFLDDLNHHEAELRDAVSDSSFLVIGGAGSIGQSVSKEIFKRNPKKLHIVDINENNIVELTRDIRSSFGYINGDFKTFALDIGSVEYDAFIEADGNYDYVLNFSALKHVRSEKDPFTLMRMIDVNILNTEKTLLQSINNKTKKYFCVSTDKATNPVNMMGASKSIMEIFLMRRSLEIEISTARFANVAFSDGSLLHSFNMRILKRQPIAAPSDIKRYFLTSKESGELCLMACILGANRDIFYPKLDQNQHLISFADIAINYINHLGYKPYICHSEREARELSSKIIKLGKWPLIFSKSDTTGEKYFEEFFTTKEILDLVRFKNLGIIKNIPSFNNDSLNYFSKTIIDMKIEKHWTKDQIINLFRILIPDFSHKETGIYLDGKM